MSQIRPFSPQITDAQLEDLRRRLAATRWAEAQTVDDWSQGTPLAELRDLVDYWRDAYDWRACEARLDAFGQFVTEIDGLDIHFLHVRSPHPDALPLIMTHGWPGSVVEFMAVIGPLIDPVAHGGKAEDAFHVVAPSLPGYGFSGRPTKPGWNVARIADAWAVLMARLGYKRWVAQGGDWGAAVTRTIGENAPDGCIGVHLNFPIATPPREALEAPTAEDRAALMRMGAFKKDESGYIELQGTRPQTLGYGLVDSPVALAAWIYEKLHAWSDHGGSVQECFGRDAILDNITLYWLTATGASSARLYWERDPDAHVGQLDLPSGFSAFPGEIMRAPRSWVERSASNIVYWNDLDKGGHFAAWEQPALFVDELRRCFALMR